LHLLLKNFEELLKGKTLAIDLLHGKSEIFHKRDDCFNYLALHYAKL